MKKLSLGLLALFLLQNAHASNDQYLSKEFEAVSSLVRSESIVDGGSGNDPDTGEIKKQ